MKNTLLIGLLFLVFSCKQTFNKESETTIKGNDFTQNIEKVHQKETFLSKSAISYAVKVAFGGNTILEGVITQLTNGSKIRIDKKDGTKIIFDNKEAFIYPNNAEDPMARFHIFTWSYFFSLPYKLNDNGTIWNAKTQKKWGEKQFDTSKLTFNSGIGDAPDDWYVIYKNPKTNILEGAAYIVSFGKELAEAEKEPHAIKFNNFITVEGVPFATNWTFHMWSDTEGYGDQIGEVKLTNIQFLEDTEALFKKPENSKLIPAPTE